MHKFGAENFKKFSGLIYDQFGIFYSEGKQDILQSKLNKLMSRHNIASYDECYEILTGMGSAGLYNDFANEITVNYTSFFREALHFDYIKRNTARLLQWKPDRYNEVRVWSAACSTGEEPYTLAMVLKEALPAGTGIRILATDINKKVLAAAQQGLYSGDIQNEVERYYLDKYFRKLPEGYLVSEAVRNLVTFRQFNLMDPFPFKNSFDMIFCRNVMIYFDAAVRQELINKFYRILHPGGLLFIGHSESLAGQTHSFRFLQPAVYEKV